MLKPVWRLEEKEQFPMDSATRKQLVEIMIALAMDSDLRKQTEKEIRKRSPNCSFYIDEGGLGHLYGPIIRTKILGT